MRIVFLNPGAQMGGAETALVELLSSLRSAEPTWDLRLLTGEEGPLLGAAKDFVNAALCLPMPAQLKEAGDSSLAHGGIQAGRLLELFRATAGLWGYARALRGQIAAWRPDLVHATGFKMQILAALCLRAPGRTLLWHIHDYVGWRPLVRRLLRLLSRRVDGALANSDSVLSDLRRNCPGLVFTQRFYNAIDAAALAGQPPADLDAAAGAPPCPEGFVRLGLVATYARWKGHETFLEALSLLPSPRHWRAYIVGGPIYRTPGSQYSALELSDAIRARGLQDHVFLTGFLNERGGVMNALDIVVHASTKPEPFGMVVVEGMVCGKAVVVSGAGGARELFEEGKSALGHAPGNSSELAAVLERLIADPALRRELGAEAKSRASADFNPKLLSRQLRDVYLRLRHGTKT